MAHRLARVFQIRIVLLVSWAFLLLLTLNDVSSQEGTAYPPSPLHTTVPVELPDSQHLSPRMRFRNLPYGRIYKDTGEDILRLSKYSKSDYPAWELQNPTSQGHSILGMAFVNNTGWAVGANGMILSTKDKGESWSVQQSGSTRWLSAVYFRSEVIGWAVGEGGIILNTTNGGSAWNVQNSRTAMHLSDVFFIDARRGWAVGDSGTVVTTLDGGASWSVRSGSTKKWLSSVFFITEAVGVAVGEEGTIVRTNNGGITWTQQPSPTTRSLYSVHFVSPDNGWAVGEMGTIIRTTDAGITWTGGVLSITHQLNSINFLNSNIGYIAGWYGLILQTSDGGNTWEKRETGIRDDLEDIALIDGLNGFAAGAWGTIVRTTNGGSKWERLNSQWSKDRLFSVCFADSVRGWAAGDNGTILHTSDGGNIWQRQSSSTTYMLRDVFFINQLKGWAVGDSGTILKTDNGGQQWSAQKSDTKAFLSGVFFIDENSGWIVGASGNILHTTDGGIKWNKQGNAANEWLSDVHFLTSQEGFAIGRDGIILHTSNAGSTWKESRQVFISERDTSGTGAAQAGRLILDTTEVRWSYHFLLSIQFVDSANGWIVGSGGTILRTSDRGRTWISQKNGASNWTEETLYEVSMVNDKVGWSVGWNGTILKTDTGGETWLPLKNLTTNGLFAVFTPIVSRAWAVGEGGTILLFHDPQTGLDERLPSGRFAVTHINTGNFSSIAAHDSTEIIHPWDKEFRLSPGDEIGIFTSKAVCAGAGKWEAKNTVLLAWGDDARSTAVEGFAEGETYQFRVWIEKEGVEYKAIPTFSSGPANYSPNGLSVVAALKLNEERPGIAVHHTIPSNSYTIGTAFKGNTSVSLTFTTGNVAGRTATFLSYGDTLSDSLKTSIDLEKALHYFHISLDSSVFFNAILASTYGVLDTSGTIGGIYPRNLAFAYFDSVDMKWKSIPTTIDTIDHRATAQMIGTASLWAFTDRTDSTITGIADFEYAHIPDIYSLGNNYPNPFNPITHIRYSLPKPADVSLKIYNILGQEILTLVYAKQPAGDYEIMWDGRSQSGIPVTSGIYFYHMRAGYFVQTKKMMLVR